MEINGLLVPTLLLSLIKALLIFFIGRAVIKLVVNQLNKFLDKKSFDPMLGRFAVSLLKILLYFVMIMAILQTLGVQTTSLIAVFGAASLAIGLALQGNLSNFASGVMLVALKPFQVGDYVEAGGNSGTVVEIGIFNSIMNTPDNKKIIIPNSSIISDSITNYSAYSERRVDLTISVDYEAKIDHVKKVITEVIDANDMILADKPVLVRLIEMADSSLNFAVRVWVSTENYWDVYFDLMESIKNRLDAEGISIPYPHVTVNIEK